MINRNIFNVLLVVSMTGIIHSSDRDVRKWFAMAEPALIAASMTVEMGRIGSTFSCNNVVLRLLENPVTPPQAYPSSYSLIHLKSDSNNRLYLRSDIKNKDLEVGLNLLADFPKSALFIELIKDRAKIQEELHFTIEGFSENGSNLNGYFTVPATDYPVKLGLENVHKKPFNKKPFSDYSPNGSQFEA
jgi:hypothetical protein